MEWQALWNHEPWGAYRDNVHAALICSTLVNLHRKKGSKQVEYDQFMLRDREEYLQSETQKTLAWFRSVARRK